MNKVKRVAFYLRSATGNVKHLTRQRESLEKAFKREGFDEMGKLVEVYTDAIQSGLQSGPDFRRMKRDIEERRIDVIMVAYQDRISRDSEICFELDRVVKTSQIRLIFAEKSFESPTHEERLRALEFLKMIRIGFHGEAKGELSRCFDNVATDKLIACNEKVRKVESAIAAISAATSSE